eukprot:244964-Pelagomonas_calceolata.AAC.1
MATQDVHHRHGLNDRYFSHMSSVCLFSTARHTSPCVVQVHDEVILEGPKETAQQAKDLVVKHMAHPWAWAAK